MSGRTPVNGMNTVDSFLASVDVILKGLSIGLKSCLLVLLFWILFLMLDDLKGERIQTFSYKVLVCHLGHYPGAFASRLYVVWFAQYIGYLANRLISSYNSPDIFIVTYVS